MCHSVKNYFSKSKSHSLNAAHDQSSLSLSENLFTKTGFLTFAFRSKCRVNKSTSCKKRPRENQYSSSSRKKTKRRPIIASAIASRLSINIMYVDSEMSGERQGFPVDSFAFIFSTETFYFCMN